MFILAHKSSQDLELFFTVAWAIWYNRNRTIHEGMCSSPLQVWQMARSSIEDFSDAATTDLSTPRPTLSSCWSPPPPGVFKINVDGASSGLDGTSSIGVIIRDCKGETIALPLQTSSVPLPGRISGTPSIGTRCLACPRFAAHSRDVRK
ncbi:hypothetical protein CFP56_035133 [Quercus suber]|uniref:RNase H type-1 domain-containing protein n=1 Tax=Quercus suber TaxID=58331 RepID=A0AAW0JAC7_QUESU